MSKKKFKEIEVTPSGKADWSGGAWCLVWVYSDKGNFLLKGFYKECKDYIKERNWKCWAFFNLYHTKKDPITTAFGNPYRTIFSTFNTDFEIYKPHSTSRKKTAKDWKYRICEKGNYRDAIFVKRLPSQFVNFNPPAYQSEPGSLGDNDVLRSLRDKFDRRRM